MDGLGMGLLFGVMTAFAVTFGYLMKRRADNLLQEWASKWQFEILEARYRPFLDKGPFWYANRGQAVYRVIVRDELGNSRKGWVRLGHWLSGIASSDVTVKWDGQPA
jgi:hypothetical protein